jgi:hypothetical protein
MKYIITENRLQELVNNYFNSFEYDIDDLGGDIVVWNSKTGMRMFDTYGDNLLIEVGLLNSLEGLFGSENIGKYILNWFNHHFDTNLDDFGEIDHDDDDETKKIMNRPNDHQILEMVRKYLDNIILPKFPEIESYNLDTLNSYDNFAQFVLNFVLDGTEYDTEEEISESVLEMRDYLSLNGFTKFLISFIVS